MKSTICITKEKRIVVTPRKGEPGVVIDLGLHTEILSMTTEQAAALIVALEMAAEESAGVAA